MTPGQPLLQLVDCVGLPVSSLDAGLAFYRDALGHELIWRTAEAAGLRMPGTTTEILLHTQPRAQEVDFKVEAVEPAVARFEAAGGRVLVPPFDIQIGRCAVVADPWGNTFVILDTSKGLLLTDDDGNVIGNAPPEP